MRRQHFAAALSLATLMIVALAAAPLFAQQGLSLPGGGLRPPPAPPIKPYQPVAVTPPAAYNDSSFVAFRKQLADVVVKKDRTALAPMIVAQNFFWVQDRDLADKRKAGIDNLAKAIDLDAKDGAGWDALNGYANEPTAAELPERKGILCAPAQPTIDAKAFEALGQATGTDPSEWGYPTNGGVDVHAAAQSNSPVIEKLGHGSHTSAAGLDPAEQSRRAAFAACRDAVRQIRLRRRPTAVAARRRRNVLRQGRHRLEDCRLCRRRLAVNDWAPVCRTASAEPLNRRIVRTTMPR